MGIEPLPSNPSDKRLIHKGVKFDLEMVRIRTTSGAILEREIVRHPGAVLIVPVARWPSADDPGAVVMIRVLRHSLGRPLLEFPAGTMGHGEDPDRCASRELTEETGYSAATWKRGGRFYPSSGMSDELMHVYVASSLEPGEQQTEDDESITTEIVPMDRVKALVRSGELVDGKSLAAWLMLKTQGLLKSPEDGD